MKTKLDKLRNLWAKIQETETNTIFLKKDAYNELELYRTKGLIATQLINSLERHIEEHKEDDYLNKLEKEIDLIITDWSDLKDKVEDFYVSSPSSGPECDKKVAKDRKDVSWSDYGLKPPASIEYEAWMESLRPVANETPQVSELPPPTFTWSGPYQDFNIDGIPSDITIIPPKEPIEIKLETRNSFPCSTGDCGCKPIVPEYRKKIKLGNNGRGVGPGLPEVSEIHELIQEELKIPTIDINWNIPPEINLLTPKESVRPYNLTVSGNTIGSFDTTSHKILDYLNTPNGKSGEDIKPIPHPSEAYIKNQAQSLTDIDGLMAKVNANIATEKAKGRWDDHALVKECDDAAMAELRKAVGIEADEPF